MIIDNKLAEAIRELSAVLQKPHDRIAELERELAAANLIRTKQLEQIQEAEADRDEFAEHLKEQLDRATAAERKRDNEREVGGKNDTPQ